MTTIMSRRCYCFSACLVLLMACYCTAFQVLTPSSRTLSLALTDVMRAPFPLSMVFADETEEKEATSDANSEEMTMDIAAQRVQSKAPPAKKEESGDGGFKIDTFSVILIAYLIFAVSDQMFHFTTDKPYSQYLVDLVSGAFGGGSENAAVVSATTSDAAETLKDIVLNGE